MFCDLQDTELAEVTWYESKVGYES